MIELSFKEDYSLMQTFECGQNFRFRTFNNGKTYYGSLEDRILKVTQKNRNTLLIESNKNSGLNEYANKFFRVDDDYISMQNAISIDDLMKKIISKTNGLHLIKQDVFECAISFLLSQCSNIPRIKKNLNTLCTKYGQEVIYDDIIFHVFPKRDDLMKVSEEDYKEMGFGYRAKYIEGFVKNYPKFLDNPVNDSEVLNKQLQSIFGIGQKVADCIQLFALGDLKLFPVDTWMRKFMEKYYFKNTNNLKATTKRMRKIGVELFGNWSGYAQEFIYHYAREFDPKK